MSSISTSTSARPSPLTRLQSELTSEIKAGTIKSADSDALSAALTSIGSSLSSSRSQASGTSRPDPAAIQTKVGSLIDQQVESGSLTSEQATELKQLFANAAPKDGEGGPGGPGGARGHGGPPPAKASDDEDSEDSSVLDILDAASGSSTTSTSSSSSSTSDTSDLLADFLKQVQSTLAQGYSQSGTTTSSSNTSLLFSISA